MQSFLKQAASNFKEKNEMRAVEVKTPEPFFKIPPSDEDTSTLEAEI